MSKKEINPNFHTLFLVHLTHLFINTHNEEISTCIYINQFLFLAGEIFLKDVMKADKVGEKEG